ncbi:MAG TPA: hypothetical protein VK125_09210 [Bacillota bacterium]|nr:hypothetical protein [Bacillota bacterium]
MIKRMFQSLIILSLFLTGCSISSGPLIFDDEEDEEIIEPSEEQKNILLLEEAMHNTESNMVENFWFRAHIANNIEKRRNTHMTVDGIVMRPDGYYMKNTLVTEPYEYYRWGDDVYIRQNDNWFRGREPELPFDIFYGFDQWKDLADEAIATRTDTVLDVPTIVYELELTGEEMLQVDPSYFEDILDDDNEQLDNVLDLTEVHVSFYIGDETEQMEGREVLPIVYKLAVNISMPIPDAGYMEQDIEHFIFRVNSDSTEMTEREEIEEYIIEIDDAQDMMDEEEEEQEEELIK